MRHPWLDDLRVKVQSASQEELEDWLFSARQLENADDRATRVWALIRAGAIEEAIEGRDPARWLEEVDRLTEDFTVKAVDELIRETSAWLLAGGEPDA